MKTTIFRFYLIKLALLSIVLVTLSCDKIPESSAIEAKFPDIFPDYTNITVPINIAPLNFMIDSCDGIYAVLQGNKINFEIKGKSKIIISSEIWKRLVSENINDTIWITVSAKYDDKWIKYKPFYVMVSGDKIDEYLVYRKIAPGYQIWSKMGLYQRNLTNFEECNIVNSDMLPGTCMNCHSFANNNATNMQMHFRMANSGTILIRNGNITKLNTKTDQTISNCVYPYWHPSKRYISYSVDKTAQMFHSQSDKRIEVFDSESDIVVYDIDQNELFTDSAISSSTDFEVAQSFSSDGKKLFYCTAKAKKMPEEYNLVKYSLCSIDFNTDSAKFSGKPDTLISAFKTGKSVSFPRTSPDGKFLLFSMSDYGYFHIWHKDADLFVMNLTDRTYFALNGINSAEAESYHSWSSNGKWIVTASRRIDGLYSYPYITHINQEGKTTKAFILPQKDPIFYTHSLFSFNVPEFVINEVGTNKYEIEKVLKTKGKQVVFRN